MLVPRAVYCGASKIVFLLSNLARTCAEQVETWALISKIPGAESVRLLACVPVHSIGSEVRLATNKREISARTAVSIGKPARRSSLQNPY